jgi:hypothetical protein
LTLSNEQLQQLDRPLFGRLTRTAPLFDDDVPPVLILAYVARDRTIGRRAMRADLIGLKRHVDCENARRVRVVHT